MAHPGRESELRRITESGPHTISAKEREINEQVFNNVSHLLPFDDIHKISDTCLIYRFLIAVQWDVAAATTNLGKYVEFRRENRLNSVLWEDIAESVVTVTPRFLGFDRFGNPTFYDRPDPGKLSKVVRTCTKEQVLRGHLKMMEQGRRLMKISGADRATCVLDLSLLTMGIVRNTTALSMLKEMSKMDQSYYPENMRTMMICNGGWAFSFIYSAISPMLDDRIRKKIQVMPSGGKMRAAMEPWLDMSKVPMSFGGDALECDAAAAMAELLDVRNTVAGSPPDLARRRESTTEQQEDREGVDSESQSEFGSFESCNDEEEPRRTSDSSKNPEPRKEVTQEPLVSNPMLERVAFGSETVMLLEVHRNGAGGEITTGFVDRVPVGQVNGSAVVACGSDGCCPTLLAEIVEEAGHPFHKHFMLIDSARRVKFVIKQRKVHKELLVFRPMRPDPLVRTEGPLRFKCSEDTTHVMTVARNAASSDIRDWICISLIGVKKETCARRSGSFVSFFAEMAALPHPLQLAFAVCIEQLWR